MEANILVVEDEKGIRDAITIYLKNQGYYVYEAENGVQGLEMVENHTIHLAIVDIMMPVMDGIISQSPLAQWNCSQGSIPICVGMNRFCS